MQSIWWQVFDILGTSAFALSGALVAISRRMDLFGIFVLAAATAVGGGIVRDLMLGHTPPSAFRTTLYVWIIALSIVAVVLFIRYVNVSSRQRLVHQMESIYLVCDAIGLGSFTVTGTLMGFYYYPQYWVLNVTLGVLTAVGGGVVRDVLAGQIP
ncbi:trimeric intracellular cation channel family protein, partial [uncultured Megasphaera sp.]|uniref:trimeric intracellular cation channel family protein n=1 Tax=uncultured Megasphaera sp. TaxID=165188 RepID=UPI00265C9D94